MKLLERLFEQNRAWSAAMHREDPRFFDRLVAQQRPEFHWIGCSDSRVPANQITGLAPGEMFVHRNVANLAHAADLNGLSSLQFAVDHLDVRHVIVCGHYGCAGIHAALTDARLGVVDNWLRPVRELAERHAGLLATLQTTPEREDRLAEINVVEQVRNVALTMVVADAWRRGQRLALHGWIYSIRDGLLRDLGCCVTGEREVAPAIAAARKALGVA